MNVNSLIINTLKPIVSAVYPNKYSGTEQTYITFNYADDRAVEFADDTPQIDKSNIQIHLFTPNDYMELKKQIRLKLFQGGFSYPSITDLYEDDTKLNHIIFECEITGNSETEE
ncbi:hypothetical protein [Anaerosacchariphilus polymeriproducens]|uniref:Phage tail protein n=1 Tax=Anaerosacchariphilus polymeriproducens TaxID=1812858 RepID=A0A371ATF8_9FIRM|nr:hypothetical protein [Anaerosacchariphilus polymeriproducens]RDU22760.1 hypothetical protein DWV06_13405 [Anaerosacchariphilus polymeriproducens]